MSNENHHSVLGNLVSMNNRYHLSAVLHFCHNSKLFEFLEESKSVGEVSTRHAWIPSKTQILLNTLVASELVESTSDQKYVISPQVAPYLIPSGNSYIGGIIDHQRLQWCLWGKLNDMLSSDSLMPDHQESRLSNSEVNEAFNKTMKVFSKDHVQDVLSNLDMTKFTRVIDICGGHGTYLSIIAKENKMITGEVWDFLANEGTANETFLEYGVSDRLTFKAIDVRSSSTFSNTPNADLVMLNDCLHYFTREECNRLVQESFKLISIKGAILISTMTLNDDLVSPPPAAFFSMHMMVNAQKGCLHPVSFYHSLLENTGLKVKTYEIGSLKQYTVLIGCNE